MEEIEIHTPEINMDQLLKWMGIIDNGAHIKIFIEDQMIKLNGAIVTERRKKVRPGDVIDIKGIGSWRVVTGEV
ncbi:RNA-binding S4 domain-containing protein [Sporomusa sp.]|uniref:RNA-binding S4 domain-containing protein n=1 Tax=Sporomusa sp. TaxID=2078658 RepID=UPI002CC987BE|nr:RNA-binding S4 domain-containing protein [Sporomusa sp.]HWR44028.1 RNA-binding S4 domain-containing protein [Sporomusa sp.]